MPYEIYARLAWPKVSKLFLEYIMINMAVPLNEMHLQMIPQWRIDRGKYLEVSLNQYQVKLWFDYYCIFYIIIC